MVLLELLVDATHGPIKTIGISDIFGIKVHEFVMAFIDNTYVYLI
jgi:hypothetical protein